jgi:hypothetical protein
MPPRSCHAGCRASWKSVPSLIPFPCGATMSPLDLRFVCHFQRLLRRVRYPRCPDEATGTAASRRPGSCPAPRLLSSSALLCRIWLDGVAAPASSAPPPALAGGTSGTVLGRAWPWVDLTSRRRRVLSGVLVVTAVAARRPPPDARQLAADYPTGGQPKTSGARKSRRSYASMSRWWRRTHQPATRAAAAAPFRSAREDHIAPPFFVRHHPTAADRRRPGRAIADLPSSRCDDVTAGSAVRVPLPAGGPDRLAAVTPPSR